MSRSHERPTRPQFERLVREHHAAVWRAASRAVRDADLAQDATQDVFVAVLEGRFLPEPGEGEGRSLRWYAARRALELGRGEGRRRAREERHAMEREHEAAGPALGADERAQVLHHVDALPDDLRAALRLRYEESMTWEAVGAALAIAPSSAHERVERALDRLRAALRAAGFAAVAVDVEARLADLPAPSVPHGLAPRLLALAPPAAASLPVALVAALALGLVGATATLAVWLGGDASVAGPAAGAGSEAVARGASVEPAPSAPLEPAAGAGRALVAGTSPEAPPAPARAPLPAPAAAPAAEVVTIAGRVLDPRGDPLEGLRVSVIPSGQKGGAMPGDPAATTLADGTFRLETARVDHPLQIVVGSDTLGRALGRSDAFALVAGPVTQAPDLVAEFAGAREPRGDWTLDVLVVDAAGAPVAGAVVRVEDGSRDPVRRTEDHGRTDAFGHVELAGARLGARDLVVDASRLGFAPARTALELAPGRAEARVVVAPGLEIAGRVTDLDGRPIAADPRDGFSPVQVLVDVPDGGTGAPVDARGGFRVGGLAAGTYPVRVYAPGRSPARLEVAAGTTDLAIALKRADDERDVGAHAAEIHGRLVDARTGAPVLADPDDVDVDPLWLLDGAAVPEGADFARDLLPWVVFGRPVQRLLANDPPPPSDRFHAVGLEAGAVVVLARVHGYGACITGPLLLAEREVRTDVELRLVPAAEIAGVVRGADGAGIADAFVVLTGEGPVSTAQLAAAEAELARDGQTWAGVRTDAQGRFAFRGLPEGLRARLAVLRAGRPTTVSDWVVAGTADVELR